MAENNSASKAIVKKDEQDPKKLTDDVHKPLKRYRKQFEPGWTREESAYYGDIWRNRNQFRPYENTIFEIIEGAVPILTDSMAGVIAQTEDPEHENTASTLTKSFEWTLKDQKFHILKPILVRNSLIGGPGYLHVYWDRNGDNGNGRQMFEVIHWRNVWLEGRSCLIDDCYKAVFEVKRDKEWLKREFPKNADEIDKVETKDTGTAIEKDREGLESFDVTGKSKRRAPIPYMDDDLLVMRITYKKDYSLIPIPEEKTLEEVQQEHEDINGDEGLDVSKYQDHESHMEAHLALLTQLYDALGLTIEDGQDAAQEVAIQAMQESPDSGADQILLQIKILEDHMESHQTLHRENPEGGMPKYKDNWRVIKTLGKLTIYDDSPEEDHGEIPLVLWYAYKDMNIYGINETRNMYDSQSMQAVMGYKVYKGLQKIANPVKIIDIETGLKKEDITNEDGGQYFIPQGTNIRNMEPGQISEQVVSFSQVRVDKMKDIAGTRAASDGKIPHPNSSALLVDKLEQQALGRVRLKDRNDQYYSMDRLAKIVISNNISFWTTEKTLRLASGDDGKLEAIIFNPAEIEDLKWEITIAPGSMAGVDKQAFNAYMLKLVELGAITVRQMLTVIDLPKKQKLMASMDENDETKAVLEELKGQLEQCQIENLKIKANVNPELLSNEERKILEDIIRQEQVEQLSQTANQI